MPYLAKDICSMMNPGKCYGRKGAEINIISDHAGVLIVKLAKFPELTGFHVLRDEVTYTPPDEEPPAQEEVAKAPPVKASGSPKAHKSKLQPPSSNPSTQQGSLF